MFKGPLKYESDCLRTGISVKYESWKVLHQIVPYEFLSSMPQPNQEILFQNKFSIPLCLSYENCKCPCRNHTPKRENCFAMFISVCNFHISLQFSYQFAIFISVCNFHISLQFSYQFSNITFWCISYMDVCNFHMGLQFSLSLQFSYQFAILASQHHTSYVHSFIWIPM
jgi:hypothetical protein